MAKPDIYLSLTASGLQAYTVPPAGATLLASFAEDEAGYASYCTFLAGHANCQFVLLTDLPDEDFCQVSIPALGARDRGKLVVRRLQQLYRGTSYCYAQRIGKGRSAKGERQEERYLLAALTNPAPIQYWLMPLLEQDSSLLAVHSVALLAARFAGVLNDGQRDFLLVSRQAGSGLRQSYFLAGRLIFSRLTSLSIDRPLAEQLAEEIVRTRQFLASSRVLERSDELSVLIVDDQAITLTLPEDERVLAQRISCNIAAQRMALPPVRQAATGGAALLWITASARSRDLNFYAPAGILRNYRLWKIRQAIWLGGALILATNAALMAWQAQIQQDNQLQIKATQQQRTRAEQAYRQNQFVPIEGEPAPEAMQAVVETYTEHVARWPPLPADLISLSKVLDAHPDVQLQRVRWAAGRNPNLLQEAGSAPPPAAGETAGHYRVYLLQGQIRPFLGRYRQAQASIDAFCAQLQRSAGVQVEKIQLPLDTRPAAQIQHTESLPGSEGDAGGEFTLRITLPPKEPAPR